MKIYYYSMDVEAGRPLYAQLRALGHHVTRVDSAASAVPAGGAFLIGPGASLDRSCALARERRAIAAGGEFLLVAGPWEDSADMHRIILAGADDYLPFPCEPAQLEARLLSIERRATASAGNVLSSRIEKANRFDALASLTSALAHDYSNLLTAIRGNADLVLMDASLGPDIRHSVEQISKAAAHAAGLNQQFAAFAGRAPSGAGQMLSLTQLVRHMHDLIRVSVPESVRVEYRLGGGLPAVEADPGQVRQLILSLVVNAGEAVPPESGVIRVRTGVESAGDASWVWLEVEDNGPGVPPEVLNHLFDPRFSTKGEERGLGLAAADSIARRWGARIEVRNLSGQGAAFCVRFPLRSAAERTVRKAPPRLRGAATLLVIDDDEAVRVAVQRLLGKAGYTVHAACSGEEGSQIYQRMSAAVDAVILDLCLPGFEGAALIRSLRELRPDARIIVWSGFGEEEIKHRLGAAADVHILTKPKDLRELASTLDAILTGPAKAG